MNLPDRSATVRTYNLKELETDRAASKELMGLRVTSKQQIECSNYHLAVLLKKVKPIGPQMTSVSKCLKQVQP